MGMQIRGARVVTRGNVNLNADSRQIVTSGLVFSLDAANSTSYQGSGNAWIDLSGNGNNFTLYDGASFSPDNGGLITFNGSNNYSNANVNMPGLTEWSIEAIVNISDASKWNVIMDIEEGIRFQTTGGSTPIFQGHYGTTPNIYGPTWIWTELYSSTVISSGVWYHTIFTNSPSNGRARVYVNGKFENSLTFAQSYATPQRPLYIGRGGWSNPAGTFLSGKVGVGRLYNRELTAIEVLQNFNATRRRYGL